MALQGEQLQVVPDIENAEHDPPLSKKPCEATVTEVGAKPSTSKINSSEWDIKLAQGADDCCHAARELPRSAFAIVGPSSSTDTKTQPRRATDVRVRDHEFT